MHFLLIGGLGQGMVSTWVDGIQNFAFPLDLGHPLVMVMWHHMGWMRWHPRAKVASFKAWEMAWPINNSMPTPFLIKLGPNLQVDLGLDSFS